LEKKILNIIFKNSLSEKFIEIMMRKKEKRKGLFLMD